jgi:hypothetical protein
MSRIIRDYFVQRVDTRKDYDFDWTDFLGTATIASAVVSCEPLGLTIESPLQIVTPKVKVFLTGGILGTDYLVKCKITTSTGIVDSVDFWLQVRA